jgi:hypothetical protein
MAYFLRYTATPEQDVERGTSLHLTGILVGQPSTWNDEDERSEEEILAEAYDLNADDIIVAEINGQPMYAQELSGLCAFELEAETLEDAIEEAKSFRYNDVYNSESMGDLVVVFAGEHEGDCPEGCVFTPSSVAYVANEA